MTRKSHKNDALQVRFYRKADPCADSGVVNPACFQHKKEEEEKGFLLLLILTNILLHRDVMTASLRLLKPW